jgi:hypothetical protein
MPRHTPLILAAFLLPLCAFACAPTPRAALHAGGPDPACLLASLKERKDEITSFKGIGKLILMIKGERLTGRVAWIGSQPDNLRVETLGPWGQPDVTFLMRSSIFYLYAHGENRCFKGKATARNLKRLVSVPVRGEDLFLIFSGQAPVLPYRQAKIGRSEHGGRWRLVLYNQWGGLVERMWIANDGNTVEAIEAFDGRGNLHYKAAFNQVQDLEGRGVPHRIIISNEQGPVLSLQVERFWTEVDIPEGAYTPRFPCDSGGRS